MLNRRGEISRSNRVDKRGINAKEISTLFRLRHRLWGQPGDGCLESRTVERQGKGKGNPKTNRRPSKNLEGVGLVEEITHSASALFGTRYARSVASRQKSRETPSLVPLAYNCGASE